MRQRKEVGAPAPAEVVAEELVDGSAEDPSCLVSFRASLKGYVEAGVAGRLNADIVAQLAADLDAVEAYSSEGALVFTIDELMPFFELVTAHTPRLADAYDAELDDLREQTDDVEGGIVVSMRRHLAAQQSILGRTS